MDSTNVPRSSYKTPPPVIEPGHTFESITSKITSVVLTKYQPFAWVVTTAIAFMFLNLLLVSVGYLFLKGVGIWGNNVPVGWAFDIINFVWWIGIGHAGTLISAILLLLKQDWRTSINRFAEAMTLFAVACALDVPADSHRPSVARGLLVDAVSQRHGHLAAVPQPAHLGRLRGQHLRHGLAAVLVHRPHPRPGDDARPGEEQGHEVHLRQPRARMARFGAALAALRERLPAARRHVDAAGALGAHGRQLRLLGRHHPRLAHDDLPAVLRRRRDLRRLRDGVDAGDSAAPDVRLRRLHHDAPSREHGEGDARHRAHRRLRLRDGSVLRLLQRESVREVHDSQPHVRAVRVVGTGC